jgi:GntR family transcriptional regulator
MPKRRDGSTLRESCPDRPRGRSAARGSGPERQINELSDKKIVKDPIYQQLNEILRDLIRRGEFGPGSKFLTEREICSRFEVSRATANKALSNLVSEGVLEFRKGVGTFVRGPGEARDFATLNSFTTNVAAAGKKPASRVLRFRRVKGRDVEPEAAAALRVAASDDVYSVERLRLADGVPMILERRYIVGRFCPGLTRDALSGSLFAELQKYGLRVVGSDEAIQAVIIKGEDARLLGVSEEGAGFLVTTVGYLEGDVPLWWERTLHRPDGFELRCRVRPAEYHPGVQRHLLP